MRIVGLLLLTLIAGCGSSPTLEELEYEAAASGDWSDVERVESMLKERQERLKPHCRHGMTRVCVEDPSGNKCGCARFTGGRR